MATVPTLYEWIGGMPALDKLMSTFYTKAATDRLLQEVFAKMSPEHVHDVALFVAEVFGGPKTYSEAHGGHANMISRHLNRHLTQEQRKRWVQLLLESADEIGIPDDPEFRSAMVSYLEWGSRLAVINSQGSTMPDLVTPMPRWGWGEVGGPYTNINK